MHNKLQELTLILNKKTIILKLTTKRYEKQYLYNKLG